MTVTPCPAAAKFRAEALWKRWRLEGVMGRLVKRSRQLAPLRRDLHASAPDIEITVDFQLSYGREDGIGHPGIVSRICVIAKGTVGVAFKFNIFMDLPV